MCLHGLLILLKSYSIHQEVFKYLLSKCGKRFIIIVGPFLVIPYFKRQGEGKTIVRFT